MRIATVVILAGLLALTATHVSARQGPAPATATTESDVQAFRRLRAEGIAAAGVDDLATASARLAEADDRIANHPGLILMRARVAAAAGQPDEALIQVRRYARGGLVFNLAGDQALSALADTPGYADAVAAIEANRAPVGADKLSEMARIEGAGLVESLIRDEARGRWLVSQVRGRTIVALADDGTVSAFLGDASATGGVLGMAVDAEAGTLWAATSPLPPAVHGLTADSVRPTPGLLRIDLATGTVLARFAAPARLSERGLGDIVRAPDGTIHVADSITGELLVMRPGATALEVLLPAGTLGSPQGMVVTPDESALIVADYSSGLWRIDRTNGTARRLNAPVEVGLIGIDGLTTDGRALYGFQNGVAPQRVLKLTPDAGWERIEAVEILAANLPMIDEPTTGLVRNRELVFVSRSQWSDFGDDGAQTTPTPAPAIIARLALD
ncbi:MAG: SMP-30/gluconolactonase/LRE family protein [Brevundimonas sp.]